MDEAKDRCIPEGRCATDSECHFVSIREAVHLREPILDRRNNGFHARPAVTGTEESGASVGEIRNKRWIDTAGSRPEPSVAGAQFGWNRDTRDLGHVYRVPIESIV